MSSSRWGLSFSSVPAPLFRECLQILCLQWFSVDFAFSGEGRRGPRGFPRRVTALHSDVTPNGSMHTAVTRQLLLELHGDETLGYYCTKKSQNLAEDYGRKEAGWNFTDRSLPEIGVDRDVFQKSGFPSGGGMMTPCWHSSYLSPAFCCSVIV